MRSLAVLQAQGSPASDQCRARSCQAASSSSSLLVQVLRGCSSQQLCLSSPRQRLLATPDSLMWSDGPGM